MFETLLGGALVLLFVCSQFCNRARLNRGLMPKGGDIDGALLVFTFVFLAVALFTMKSMLVVSGLSLVFCGLNSGLYQKTKARPQRDGLMTFFLVFFTALFGLMTYALFFFGLPFTSVQMFVGLPVAVGFGQVAGMLWRRLRA